MVACTGWTWDYVEQELDVPRLTALTTYWRNNPPLHVMVAAYLGIKPKATPKENDPAEIDAFVSALKFVP